ncbi:ABC transporter ATP-binding protein [Patulibacter sp. SYSU D01012]|uniref:ABC transporter ATP-binding protein n=1 Tax=Patulibacter sp. SYSU D01012 TaxID=2817381 RepID=UPI001B302A46|nr:ABC transporter ATP-binding protein [Patulibacter sp. SYSU D01012]
MAFLQARDLVVEYRTRRGPVRALDGASLDVAPGEIVGVVGESGSGKSTVGAAMGRLLPRNAGVVAGEVRVGDVPLSGLDDAGLRALRREQLGFVFQDPIGTLDPTARIGRQMRWALGRDAAHDEIAERLAHVRLPDPARVMRAYPHQLSGGMAQRVSIALALANAPRAVIADEPTASLDASVRTEILELLVGVVRETGAALVLMSHDLRAVRRFCTRVAVVYGGRVVETAPADELFVAPAHPYTRALLDAAPGAERPGETLRPIPGRPPVLRGPYPGCAFAPRCPVQVAACTAERPQPARARGAEAGHEVLCHVAADAPIPVAAGEPA